LTVVYENEIGGEKVFTLCRTVFGKNCFWEGPNSPSYLNNGSRDKSECHEISSAMNFTEDLSWCGWFTLTVNQEYLDQYSTAYCDQLPDVRTLRQMTWQFCKYVASIKIIVNVYDSRVLLDVWVLLLQLIKPRCAQDAYVSRFAKVHM